MQPYLGNILREINRELRWLTADRGSAVACELLRAVIVHANELMRKYLTESCFICGLTLDDDNSYGTDEFPACREHHGAVEFMAAFVRAGGTAEELQRVAEYAERKRREMEAEKELTE